MERGKFCASCTGSCELAFLKFFQGVQLAICSFIGITHISDFQMLLAVKEGEI